MSLTKLDKHSLDYKRRMMDSDIEDSSEEEKEEKVE